MQIPIANIVFMQGMDLLIPHPGPIYRAMFMLKTYLKQWKDSNTVVLRKPLRPDYMLPNMH